MAYGDNFKINLHLNSSSARLMYLGKSSASESARSWIIMERGEPKLPPELDMEGRFSVEDVTCTLEQVRDTDKGLYLVTDLQDFVVSNIYLSVKGKRN